MRHILFLVAFLILNASVPSLAQPKAIGIEYNDFAFTRNFNLTYHHSFLKNSFSVYGGFGYHINNNLHLSTIVPTDNGTPDERAVFYTLEATELFIRMGIKFGVEKTIKLPNRNSNAFVFYDFQYYNPDMTGVGSGMDSFGNAVTYTPFPFPYATNPNVYLHHIGFGLRTTVYKNINLKLMASMGVYKLKGLGFAWNGYENFPKGWQFSRMFGVGVEYSLFKEKEHKKKKGLLPSRG